MAKKKGTRTKAVKRPDAPPAPTIIYHIKLRQVQLASVDTRSDVLADKNPDTIQLNFTSTIRQSDEIPDMLLVAMTTKVMAVFKADETSRVSLECVYNLFYRSTEPLPNSKKKLPKHEANAIGTLAAFSAWPYVRELVSSMSSRMGIPALVLPSLRGNPIDGSIEIVD